MVHFFIDRIRRSIIASVGLLIFAVGIYFQLKADIGVAPWNAFSQGLSIKFNTTYGTASIIVSLIVICVDLLMKERLGIGTFLDAFLVGIGTDICQAIDFLPEPTNLMTRIIILVIGIAIGCFGQGVYMQAALSCGPRDAMLVGVGKRFPNVAIGHVNMVILACVLICCIPLGSTIGIGTVICVFGTGMIMEIIFKIMRFEPRNVVHEGLIETAAAFAEAAKGRK